MLLQGPKGSLLVEIPDFMLQHPVTDHTGSAEELQAGKARRPASQA